MKPVRKIPLGTKSLTGILSSRNSKGQHSFESSLERDFFIILDFDLNVKKYCEQPVTISYYDKKGKQHTYTPDVMIEYHKDYMTGMSRTPEICEIKYSNDLIKNWRLYHPKYSAAIRYAKENSMKFRVVTERDIRSTMLKNIKFLREYQDDREDYDLEIRMKMLDNLYELRITTPDALLSTLYRDPINRAKILPMLWHFIAAGNIGTDLNKPLTMFSQIWTIRK